jgi:hypothetical protein
LSHSASPSMSKLSEQGSLDSHGNSVDLTIVLTPLMASTRVSCHLLIRRKGIESNP